MRPEKYKKSICALYLQLWGENVVLYLKHIRCKNVSPYGGGCNELVPQGH